VQPIDPRPAWDEALAAVRAQAAAVELRGWQAPPSWPQLVVAHEPAAAVAFSLGNFPQLVRNLHLLTQKADLSELRPVSGHAVCPPALLEWAAQAGRKGQYPQALLAAGVLRLAKQFEQADELLGSLEASVPGEWRDALANEKAALLWHRGRAEEARALWRTLPATVPVLFNRGMAALFSNQPQEARTALEEAVSRLPEAGAWHHLGRLYLALAEMKR
jgi:tetratricopeptide (TPR) repeat protein